MYTVQCTFTPAVNFSTQNSAHPTNLSARNFQDSRPFHENCIMEKSSRNICMELAGFYVETGLAHWFLKAQKRFDMVVKFSSNFSCHWQISWTKYFSLEWFERQRFCRRKKTHITVYTSTHHLSFLLSLSLPLFLSLFLSLSPFFVYYRNLVRVSAIQNK